MHLPLCPIYGIGALLITAVCEKNKNVFAVFFLGAVISSAAELAASYIVEKLLCIRPWDYSDWPFAFEWRISLLSSIIFGLFAVYLMKAVIPLRDKIAEKISLKPRFAVCAAVIAAVAADAVICLSEI